MEKFIMNKTLKKCLIFTGIGIDVAATIFLLVVAIIMLATMPSAEDVQLHPEAVIETRGAFIGNLQLNSSLYFFSCVLPLIILFVGNIVGLFFYVRYIGKRKAQLADLSDDQKEALKAELLKELSSSKSKEKSLESNAEVEAAPEVTDSPEVGNE